VKVKHPNKIMLYLIFSDWGPNHRGLGFYFPEKATKKFLHANNLKMICRANGVLVDVRQAPFQILMI